MKTSLKTEAKPFLKWAGGKGQLINQIKEFIPPEFVTPKKIDKYFEPFVGGGAVFFWLTREYQIKKAYLYDINPEIVSAYQTIRDRLRKLVFELQGLEDEYLSSSKTEREKFFYAKRVEYNDYISEKRTNHVVRRTALMIFLNKTCFNGLFRVNSQGLFNVPFGRYENPTICDEKNLQAVSFVLQNAEIECVDFAHCLKKADKSSLVYFDPPYRPISKTASFTGYIKNGFNDEDQKRLKKVCDQLSKIGSKVILSNSDPKNVDPKDNFFEDLYHKYYKKSLHATRMINCNAERRGMIKEILVMNYESPRRGLA
jgi:DNA adenine methylase